MSAKECVASKLTDYIHNTSHRRTEMKTEVAECKLHNGEWLVETIGSDGEVYMARFSGPDSELRARRYAATFV